MIGVIANPRARAVARNPRVIERLRAVLGESGSVVPVSDSDELRSALAGFRSRGCDLVATCGGDGTNVFVLTEMARVWDGHPLPRLALLRGGTINVVAKNLGIRGRPEANLARLVAARRRGSSLRVTTIDLLKVQDRMGFIFGAGLPSKLLAEYYDGRGTGESRAFSLAARAMASALVDGPFSRSLLSPIDACVTCDGRSLGLVRPSVLLATTMADVGLGLRVGYRARSEPGFFHALALTLEPRDLWGALVPALRGRPLTARPVLDALAQRLDIAFAEPLPWLLDGEIFEAASVTVRVALRVELELP